MLAFLSVAIMVVGGGLFLGSAQEEGVEVSITRSEDGDVVCNKSCNGTFSTYLVEERECANSTDLNRGEQGGKSLISAYYQIGWDSGGLL